MLYEIHVSNSGGVKAVAGWMGREGKGKGDGKGMRGQSPSLSTTQRCNLFVYFPFYINVSLVN